MLFHWYIIGIMKKYFALFVLGMFLFSFKSDPKNQEKELGKVTWFRNYDEALLKAKELDKPVFLFFQEVPGCATCRNYGFNVMSDPMMVDIIENEFIPLCIFNNEKGHDKEILDKYKEPSWNNPVVRILNKEGESLVRINGKYSTKEVLNETLNVLEKNYSIPKYASLYQESLNVAKKESHYFQMYCFWSGEGKLGDVEGVVSTEPGWMNGAEVVWIETDAENMSQEEIKEIGESKGLMYLENPSEFRVDKDPQYYIKNSDYAFIPLLEIQKSRINSALFNKQDASSFLSPSQKQWLKENNSKKSLYDSDFAKTWWELKGL